MKKASCILGAGFSSIAGLPLARDLLTSDAVVVSESSAQHFTAVWEDYEKWLKQNPGGYPETYLGELYQQIRAHPSPPFKWAVELVAAVLASSQPIDSYRAINPRYVTRITQPSRCPTHIRFMEIVSTFFDLGIVTTNYDLLIEQCLRHRIMKRSFGPGFYYGGIGRPQVLKGAALPFSVTRQLRYVELTGSIPLFKLHGSLNWSLHTNKLEMYQDMRPAFRHGNDAAIVPPIPEKTVPEWLECVWKAAEEQLSNSSHWIVCGYSLPSYDLAIRDMLIRAASANLVGIVICDPASKEIAHRYTKVAPQAKIKCIPGLPEGLVKLESILSHL